MTADPERPSSPRIPLDTGGMGVEDLHSLICAHIGSILKPYADNVYELRMTVQHLSSNVCDLQETVDRMQEEDKLKQFAESTHQFLDGFIDESGKIEQEKAKSIQNLEETLTLIKSDMEQLRKNGEDTRAKLVVCQDAGKENRVNCEQLKNKLDRMADMADNIQMTDEEAQEVEGFLMQMEEANEETLKEIEEEKKKVDKLKKDLEQQEDKASRATLDANVRQDDRDGAEMPVVQKPSINELQESAKTWSIDNHSHRSIARRSRLEHLERKLHRRKVENRFAMDKEFSAAEN